MASCSNDTTIKIWDLVSGDCLMNLTGHTMGVYKIAELSKNRLVSFSVDRSIRLWSLETGECLKTIKIEFKAKEKQSIGSIKIISNEIMVCGRSKAIEIYDLNSGDLVKSLYGHLDSVQCVDVLSDGRIVSASWDKSIKIWNLKSGKCLHTIKDTVQTGSVLCMLVLPDDTLVTGSGDKTIKVWDLKNNMLVNTLIGHTGTVSCLVAISDDRICSGSWDGMIKFWDLTSSICLQTISKAGTVYSLNYF